MMLQESGTTGVLTPAELVALFGTYYPAPMPPEQALTLAGLTDKADARIGTLSGGQRQRLYFALAVCGNPDALFLDEPTVAMDVEARRAFVASIHTLAAGGKTVVFTTHYLREAEELARRIVVIDHGVVIADAAPRDLMARVAAKRVAFRTPAPLPAAVFDGLAVTALDAADGRVRFLTNEPESVLRALFQRGVEMRELEVVGAESRGGLPLPHPAGGGGITAAGATAPLLPMLLVQTRSELRMRWRVAAFSLTSLLLPIVFFTFFGLPFVRQTFPNGVSVGAYLLASFAAYAVGNVMVYGFGIGVAVERGQKVDLLLRATPLPPAIAITAKVLNALIFSLLSITALIVYGVVVGAPAFTRIHVKCACLT